MTNNLFILLLFILKISFSIQICEEGKNYCFKCDYRTKLCSKCKKDILVPDENGGYEGAKKCKVGEIIVPIVKKMDIYVKCVMMVMFQMKMEVAQIQIIVKYQKKENVLNAKKILF